MRGAAAARRDREGAPRPRTRRRLRRLEHDPNALALVRSVAEIRGIDIGELMLSCRGAAEVARSRQMAMYLVHVLLGRPQEEVGSIFRRDRTTVAHACHLVEDRRDDPRFEAEIAAVEARFSERLEQRAQHHG